VDEKDSVHLTTVVKVTLRPVVTQVL